MKLAFVFALILAFNVAAIFTAHPAKPAVQSLDCARVMKAHEKRCAETRRQLAKYKWSNEEAKRILERDECL